MQDAGSWKLDTGYWILDAGSWMLDAGHWMLDARYWILDVGCWTLVITHYPSPITHHPLPITRHPFPLTLCSESSHNFIIARLFSQRAQNFLASAAAASLRASGNGLRAPQQLRGWSRRAGGVNTPSQIGFYDLGDASDKTQ